MDEQFLFAVLRPDAWPTVQQLHTTALAAWQQHLNSCATGHTLLRDARRAANLTGVTCRVFRLCPAGSCDVGL